METLIKVKPKFIAVTSNPAMIVGEKIGNQRVGEEGYALVGNRTGDFVHEAIGDKTNIILTNVVNVFYPGNFDPNRYVQEGLEDLLRLIMKHRPKVIICLGNTAAYYVNAMLKNAPSYTVFTMPHPSFINRFKSKQRPLYIARLRTYLNV